MNANINIEFLRMNVIYIYVYLKINIYIYINMIHPNNCPGPLRWHTAPVSQGLIENIDTNMNGVKCIYIYL